MASSNPFASLLNQEDVTARLAILQPATDSDAPIKLSLTEAVLKDTSYEVISYDRSSSETVDDGVTISVDDQDHPIPRALDSALRTFRRKERPRTLWADLLVGRTAEERSAQATSQRHVLAGAERTLCWLGPDKGEATAKAFETLREMGRRYDAACAEVGIGPDQSISKATLQQMAGLRNRLHSCPFDDLHSFDFAHWRLVYDVFAASYWRSVHCIPDIVLARAPLVVCGRSNIRWHAYIAASRAMPFFQVKFFQVPLPPRVAQGFEIANSIEVAERRRRLGDSLELLPMIHTARDCGAADARENVFAMLHVATPSGRVRCHAAGPQPLPRADYARGAARVFADAARYSVLERQDLMLWFDDRPPCARRRARGLPSWVPDFGTPPPKLAVAGLFNPNAGMRAWWDHIQPPAARKHITVTDRAPTSSSSSSSSPPAAGAEEEEESVGMALHLQARPLDRIVHASSIFNAGNCRRLAASEFFALPSAPTAEMAERFWRTLILNAGDMPGVSSAAAAASTSTLRDVPAAPADLEVAFASVLAEERILSALGCATVDEMRTPANAARMRAAPDLMALVPRCGRAAPFERLLARHAAGRRFFRTAGGRFGMSAVEDPGAADERFLGEKREGESEEEEQERRPPEEGLGRLMSDPMTRAMIGGFQQYLAQRDPAAAHVAAQALRGEVPGMPAEARKRTDGGVNEGDVVVACVGGFFPYVLRPWSPPRKEGEEETAEEDDDGSTYEFVGECYLYGAMDGEDFKVVGPHGQKRFSVDVSKLVDITIV
ncbi:hypothetical protein GGR52DRAFT_585374 [Hypoxylon sp. FL1284]|nr:hypothetical protein GGR52DRAFT_585374 [Hypoxylon sp. FL1284]